MGDHFSVGLRAEFVALRYQAFAQCFVVFDDAVVNHRNFIARRVRMRVDRRGRAMCCPARMGDAAGGGEVPRVGLRR
jgi:hypothetical protein